MSYLFRREDTGVVVEVDFATMMQQDAAGFITLPDGTQARRSIASERQQSAAAVDECLKSLSRGGPSPEIISDAMGVTCNQVEEMRQDAAKNGMAVEFVRDPLEPTFYQAKFGSWKEWDRYRRHRGFTDNNGKNGGGATLTPDQFERAKKRILEDAEESGLNGGSPSKFTVDGGETLTGTVKIGIKVVDIAANAAQDGD